MSMSRIDQIFGRGSGSLCRAKRRLVSVTGTVASQMMTPPARIHGVDPNARATRPARGDDQADVADAERPDGDPPEPVVQ